MRVAIIVYSTMEPTSVFVRFSLCDHGMVIIMSIILIIRLTTIIIIRGVAITTQFKNIFLKTFNNLIAFGCHLFSKCYRPIMKSVVDPQVVRLQHLHEPFYEIVYATQKHAVVTWLRLHTRLSISENFQSQIFRSFTGNFWLIRRLIFSFGVISTYSAYKFKRRSNVNSWTDTYWTDIDRRGHIHRL